MAGAAAKAAVRKSAVAGGMTVLLAFLPETSVFAQEEVNLPGRKVVSVMLDSGEFRMSATPRTPDQMAAFYIGRRFPRDVVEETRKLCFVTVGVRNLTRAVVWLEPERWRFVNDRGEHRRLSREDWRKRLDAMNAPPAVRTTLTWTQLPDERDLQPNENVGANAAIPPIAGEFTLEARFATGVDRRGPEFVVKIPGLSCPGRGKNGVKP